VAQAPGTKQLPQSNGRGHSEYAARAWDYRRHSITIPPCHPKGMPRAASAAWWLPCTAPEHANDYNVVESTNSDVPKSGRFPRLGLFSISPFLNGARGARGSRPTRPGSNTPGAPSLRRAGAAPRPLPGEQQHTAVSPHRVPYGRPFGDLLVILTAELSSYVPPNTAGNAAGRSSTFR
jgi:hypothetical protein